MRAFVVLAIVATAFQSAAASAAAIPSPDVIERESGARPVTITVVEPHLATPEKRVEIAYEAFPAPVALSAALGPDWATKAKAITFRALDGYVSHVDVARLVSGKAFLAFAGANGAPFTVDNLAQNERNLALGPYYLVWDNRNDPELIAQGARDWPYKIADVSFAVDSDAALRPAPFDQKLEAGLAAFEASCLSCHQVNGYGGDKLAANLATIARGLAPEDFMRWTLDPAAAKPGATMPPLAPNLPEAERVAKAQAIYEYLTGVRLAPQQ